jgi:hypothetical protein
VSYSHIEPNPLPQEKPCDAVISQERSWEPDPSGHDLDLLLAPINRQDLSPEDGPRLAKEYKKAARRYNLAYHHVTIRNRAVASWYLVSGVKNRLLNFVRRIRSTCSRQHHHRPHRARSSLSSGDSDGGGGEPSSSAVRVASSGVLS